MILMLINVMLISICGGRTTASISAFQAEDEGSIPFRRSNKLLLHILAMLPFYFICVRFAKPKRFTPSIGLWSISPTGLR